MTVNPFFLKKVALQDPSDLQELTARAVRFRLESHTSDLIKKHQLKLKINEKHSRIFVWFFLRFHAASCYNNADFYYDLDCCYKSNLVCNLNFIDSVYFGHSLRYFLGGIQHQHSCYHVYTRDTGQHSKLQSYQRFGSRCSSSMPTILCQPTR